VGSLSDVVDGYTSLASSILDRWSNLAGRAAEEFENGEYDAGCAAEDVATGAWLASLGGLEWVEQYCEALETLVGFEEAGSAALTSPPFPAPPGARLKLVTTFQSGPGLQFLLPEEISIQWLNDAEFVLRANVTECHGGTYYGVVRAETDSASTDQWVWIAIP
jgi:hypothetical protein